MKGRRSSTPPSRTLSCPGTGDNSGRTGLSSSSPFSCSTRIVWISHTIYFTIILFVLSFFGDVVLFLYVYPFTLMYFDR